MPKADILGAGKQQCLAGNKFTFKQQYPWTGANPTHVWTTSDGGSGSGDSLVRSFTAMGKYRVFHSITTNDGCFDSTSEVVDVVPSPKASFTTSKDTACLGEPMVHIRERLNILGLPPLVAPSHHLPPHPSHLAWWPLDPQSLLAHLQANLLAL